MFLRVGLVSLVLLLASRVSGLVREVGLASVLGTGPVADAVIVMLTLPDLLVGVALAGATGYVLIPYWAHLNPLQAALHQAKVLRVWIVLGVVAACVLWAGAEIWARVLSPSGWLAAPELIVRALYGAALVTPLAFSAAVLGARLQHQSDMVGLYGANLLVNGVLLACLGGMAWFSVGESIALYVVGWMAIGLLAAMVARLLWQLHRLALARRGCSGVGDSADSTTRRRPEVLDWCAAIVVAGGPIVLYLVARSLAARDGAGALSTFNYAWKLVELPQLLAVQLVATLALPAVSKGCAGPGDAWRIVFHRAFALAWVLACSAVVVVVWGSESISDAMYGWGRMDGASVQTVAGWARSGAWCLLPSAAVYMWLVLFASRGRLQQVASTWLVVGTLAIAAGWSWVDTGSKAMVWLNVTWLAMAAAMFWRSNGLLQASVPWLELLWPTLLAGVAGIVARYAGLEWRGLPVGLACMACILLVAWGTSSSFRCAVQLRSA